MLEKIIWQVMSCAFYLAVYLRVTRCAYGVWATLGVYAAHVVLRVLFMWYCLPPDVTLKSYVQGAFLLFAALLCVIMFLMGKGQRSRRCFMVALALCYVTITIMVCRLIGHWAEPRESLALEALFLVVVGWVFCMRIAPRVDRISADANWSLLSLLGWVSWLVVFYASVWPIWVIGERWQHVMMFFLVSGIVVTFYPILLSYLETCQAEREARQMVGNTAMLRAELQIVQAAEDGARRVRHDLRHHVETLVRLLEEGQTELVLRYVRGSLSHEMLLPPSGERWCDNVLVNTILAVGARRVRAKGVEYRAEAHVPKTLEIDELDLVALLSNLIENAANECAGGTVRVSVVEDRGALRIGVSNKVKPGFALRNGLPCERPGVGILSARAVVEKYRGLYDYELDGDTLTARIMIGGVK